jgi:hypothetical protein
MHITFLFACLAQVEIGANIALIAHSDNRRDVAPIAHDVRMRGASLVFGTATTFTETGRMTRSRDTHQRFLKLHEGMRVWFASLTARAVVEIRAHSTLEASATNRMRIAAVACDSKMNCFILLLASLLLVARLRSIVNAKISEYSANGAQTRHESSANGVQTRHIATIQQRKD